MQTIAARLRTLDPFLKISDVPPLECHPMSSLEETKLLEKTQRQLSHILNVLHPGTKSGNAYAIAYVLLPRAQRAYLVLRGAYAGVHAPQFFLRHTLTRGPLLKMNTRSRLLLASVAAAHLGGDVLPSAQSLPESRQKSLASCNRGSMEMLAFGRRGNFL